MKSFNYIDLGVHSGSEIKTVLSNSKNMNIKIFGVECNPNIFKDIKKEFADKKNVYLQNICIGPNEGETHLYLPKNPMPQGSSIYKDKANVTTKNFKVTQKTFANYFKKLDLLDGKTIVKINIEGAERDFIKSCHENNLFKKIDFIVAAKGDLLTDVKKIKSLHPEIPLLKKMIATQKHKIFDIKQLKRILK